MKTIIRFRLLLVTLALLLGSLNAGAIALWVGQSYTWDFSGSVMGSTYNMSVTSNGGYLSITGSGFYRTITPTQYFSGSATVTAEWDYTLYYGDTKKHQRVTLTVTCNENKVSISPTSVTLSPGQTYQLAYRHAYDNQYVGAANAYFSGGNSSFTVSSSGLITAKSPGTGYVTVYSKVSNAANAPSCYVTVKEVEPTGASTGNVSLLADQSKDLTVTVSPSNASVKSKQWYIKSGSDIVSISGQRITGMKPGTAAIYCMVNGSVRSNDATVTVTEPSLTKSSTIPTIDATGISVFTNPSVTYSHSISKGSGFSSITFTGNGTRVDGTVELSGSTVRFLPTKPLSPLTTYKLYIPRNAVINKWGSSAQSDVTLAFTTGLLEKATVSLTPVSGSYLTKDDGVTLSAHPSDAIIYYTMDGSTPTTSSRAYAEPIKSDKDFTIKVFAIRDGYENSEMVSGQYYKSQSEIVSYYPNDANPLFNYAWASPHIKLSGPVEKSNNFRRITLTDGGGNSITGQPFITNHMIIFVPDEPLENSTRYTMDIPRDAVKTNNGEVFKGFNWTFTTPTKPVAVAMQGDESVYVLSENGSLQTRGMDYLTTNVTDGSFTYKDIETLSSQLNGVNAIAAGYTHRLISKNATVTGYGRALCGETGSASGVSAKVVRAGFQTSAIIGNDNTLWMCGRNDFYQLADGSGKTAKSFVKVADNVIDVALGNGFTLYVDTDNVLWGVGRNHRGQLGDGTRTDRQEPVKIMDGVSRVYASVSGFFSACITTDDNLLTWGDNSAGQLGRETGKYSSAPGQAMSGVVLASLGESHCLALTENSKLYSWGSNAYGQIAKSSGNVSRPTVMAENIMSAVAGPNTSLILANSGKVTGWGRKSHNNFGSGDGNVSDYVVYDGLPYSSLQSVKIEPYRYETEPENSFALVAIPSPLTADYETVEWSSDRPDVAAVDGNGIVHTDGFGEATITVKLTDRFGNIRTSAATIISTDNPDNSGVSYVTTATDDWYVYTDGDMIVIEKAHIGELYTVYNIQGMVIGQQQADKQHITFTTSQPGAYIVQSATKVVKIMRR